MDEIPILSRADGSDTVKEFMSLYDAPAYVRRARRVQGAYEELLHRCRQQRAEWLPMARTRLGMLRALAGELDVLRPLLADDDQVESLRQLERDLNPKLRVPVQPTPSARKHRRALLELNESLGRFNECWRGFLPTVDLTEVNELRDGYNRYFLLEKECALRSARLARQGFVRLEPLTLEHLAAALPPLPVPRLKD